VIQPRPSRALALALVIAAALAACQPTDPSPSPTLPVGSPTPSEAAPDPEVILGCVSIEAAECQFVLEQILAVLPEPRGAPATVQVVLAGCANPGVCPRTLAIRDGQAVVEYIDGDDPIQLALQGPAQAPQIAEVEGFWSDLIQPGTPPIGGFAPVAFEIGHCGLSHVVDFDGAFWVPVGQVDGDAPGFRNAESGQIRLVGPNLAEYQGPDGFRVSLARFPGPKHFFMCD
jgi:hypothetical protein